MHSSTLSRVVNIPPIHVSTVVRHRCSTAFHVRWAWRSIRTHRYSTLTHQVNKPRRHEPISAYSGQEKTWEELGLRKSLVEGLLRAYPEVVAPTTAQTMFIPAILEGKDLLVKDDAGSGKHVLFCMRVWVVYIYLFFLFIQVFWYRTRTIRKTSRQVYD